MVKKPAARTGTPVLRKKRTKKRPSRDPDHTAATVGRGTFGEWLKYVGAEMDDAGWIPVWPPDAFAISAAFLRRTGAYVGLVNDWRSKWRLLAKSDAAQVGKHWRDVWSSVLQDDMARKRTRFRELCPPEVKQWWQVLVDRADRRWSDAGSDDQLVSAACNLVIAADSACAGIGVSLNRSRDGKIDSFLATADAMLGRNSRQSFCYEIPPEKLAVLGKQHTPQRGCTIRSLTHHLALYMPTEITAYWAGPYTPKGGEDLDVFNLLLLPWPTEVASCDFALAGERAGSRRRSLHRYFEYSPPSPEKAIPFGRRFAQALQQAQAHAEHIHGVVFPELSLTWDQFLEVERIATRNRTMLVAGVRGGKDRFGLGAPVNACVIQALGLTDVPDSVLSRRNEMWEQIRISQFKHHRWCLDRNQILQYELGGRLPASHDCWENIHIGDRRISFLTLTWWLTTCVLICEDLARQDPVSDVVRAVGPNLVFALLMDGPQLRNRWPSRYASVLAEDPGCSVLTLTSLGMAKRSKTRGPGEVMPDKSTTIALWRDALDGEREIALSPGDDACVLSLVCRSVEEFTIDGRGDHSHAHFPVFAGATSFKTGAR